MVRHCVNQLAKPQAVRLSVQCIKISEVQGYQMLLQSFRKRELKMIINLVIYKILIKIFSIPFLLLTAQFHSIDVLKKISVLEILQKEGTQNTGGWMIAVQKGKFTSQNLLFLHISALHHYKGKLPEFFFFLTSNNLSRF